MKQHSLVIGAVVMQFAVVGVLVWSAIGPLLSGREITLMALPRDPRDLMRGDYVELRYGIEELSMDGLTTDLQPVDVVQFGDELFVTLDSTVTGVVATGVFHTKPTSGLFILGRSVQRRSVDDTSHQRPPNATLSLRYGIEEYYTKTETAQRLEQRLRSSGMAIPVVVKIDTDGRARIDHIVD